MVNLLLWGTKKLALLAELVDATGLKPGVPKARVGSSPTEGTKINYQREYYLLRMEYYKLWKAHHAHVQKELR